MRDFKKKKPWLFILVLAFEQMKMEAAFTPVFFASIGWYSNASKSKEVAKRALESITDDPTDPLMKSSRPPRKSPISLQPLR
jgi:hypothetical protein